jgi:hypothetical protein
MTDVPETVAPEPVADSSPPKSRRLGVVALILALVVAAISMTVSLILGLASGPLAEAGASGFSFHLNTASSNPVEAQIALYFILNAVFGTLAGTWALIQGLVAAVTKRGRLWGVLAMFVAAGAPIVSFITFAIATSASTPAG